MLDSHRHMLRVIANKEKGAVNNMSWIQSAPIIVIIVG